MKIVNKLILSALSMFSVFNVVYAVTKEPTINYAASTEQRNYIQIDTTLVNNGEFLNVDEQLSLNDKWLGALSVNGTFVKDANSRGTAYLGLKKVKHEIARNTNQIAFEIPKLQGHYSSTDNLKYLYYQFNATNMFSSNDEYVSYDFVWINDEPVASLVWTNDGLTIYGDEEGESDSVLRFADDGMVYVDSHFERIKNFEIYVPWSSAWKNNDGGLKFYSNTYTDAGHIDCYVDSADRVNKDDSAIQEYGADIILNIKNKSYVMNGNNVENIPFSVEIATEYNGASTIYDLVELQDKPGSYYVENLQVENFDESVNDEISYFVKKINYRQIHKKSGNIVQSIVKNIADEFVTNYVVKSVTATTYIDSKILPNTQPKKQWYDTILKSDQFRWIYVDTDGERKYMTFDKPFYEYIKHDYETVGNFIYFNAEFVDGTPITNMETLRFVYTNNENKQKTIELDVQYEGLSPEFLTDDMWFNFDETKISDQYMLINLREGVFQYNGRSYYANGQWWPQYDEQMDTLNQEYDYVIVMYDTIAKVDKELQDDYPERNVGDNAISMLKADFTTSSGALRTTSWYENGLHEVYNSVTCKYDVYDQYGNKVDETEYIYDINSKLILDAVTEKRVATENQHWEELKPTHEDTSDVCNIFTNIEACLDNTNSDNLLKYIKIVGGVLLGIVGLIVGIKLIDVFNSISTKIKEKKKK